VSGCEVTPTCLSVGQFRFVRFLLFCECASSATGTEHLTHPLTHLLVHILVQIYHDSLYADNLAWLRTITSDRLLFRLLIDELVCGQCMHLSACHVRICIQLLLLIDELVCGQCMHLSACHVRICIQLLLLTPKLLTSAESSPYAQSGLFVVNACMSACHRPHLHTQPPLLTP
jgi:hypothetical protein